MLQLLILRFQEFNRAIELKVKAEQEALQAKNEKTRRVTQAKLQLLKKNWLLKLKPIKYLLSQKLEQVQLKEKQMH